MPGLGTEEEASVEGGRVQEILRSMRLRVSAWRARWTGVVVGSAGCGATRVAGDDEGRVHRLSGDPGREHRR